MDTKRRRVEMQGFLKLDDHSVNELDRWLRFSPAICMIVAAVGTLRESAWIMFGLLPFALAGVVLPRHPFDSIYNHGIRIWTRGVAIPRYEAPRRFACAVASALLISSGFAFHEGAAMIGIVLGGLLAVAAAVPVLTGFCIPSWIYQQACSRLGETDGAGVYCDGFWSLRSAWRGRSRS